MKVLQISSNWGHGGPGGVEKDLYQVIVDSGNECVVAYGRDDIPDNVPSIQIGSKFGTYCHGLSARIIDNAGFGSRKVTEQFIKKIDECNPDIIQLHNLLGYYINIEILFDYLKTCGKPIVWTVHDCWPFTGHCINFERTGCRKWIQGCHDCPLKHDYPQRYFLDNSKRNWIKKRTSFTGVPNMTIVSPSEWLRNLLLQSFMKEYPIEVINNGIDLNIFKPTESSIREKYQTENKKLLLAVAGVWNEMKGEYLLYELASKLDNPYVLVMIGTKSSKTVPSNIISLDRTDNIKELVEWYTAADVFVNPTLGDNYPTVNLEAMACGTPVVTNNTGGSGEIAANEAGRIVYSKSADEFVQKIKECYEAQIPQDRIMAKAHEFDSRKCYEKYIEIYKEIIRTSGINRAQEK